MSCIKDAIIGVDNNTTINKGTRRATTNFVYNKELDIGSIQSITTIDRSNYSIDSSDYSTTRSISKF